MHPPIFNEKTGLSVVIREIEHYDSVADLIDKSKTEDVKILQESIFDSTFCSTITCDSVKCGQNNGRGCSSDASCCKKCYCKETAYLKVKHQEEDHVSIWHGDHIDYLVSGVLHYQIDGLCYNHGTLNVHSMGV